MKKYLKKKKLEVSTNKKIKLKKKIGKVNQYKYLGSCFNRRNTMKTHIKNNGKKK